VNSRLGYDPASAAFPGYDGHMHQCDRRKIHFNGAGGSTDPHRLHAPNAFDISWSIMMSKNSTKILLVLLAALAAPAASSARQAGEAGMGNVPISGIPPGPANAGGMNNVAVDPSGIGNAARMAPLPPPRITVPVIPKFK
jgi:hypothetical protein